MMHKLQDISLHCWLLLDFFQVNKEKCHACYLRMLILITLEFYQEKKVLSKFYKDAYQLKNTIKKVNLTN